MESFEMDMFSHIYQICWYSSTTTKRSRVWACSTNKKFWFTTTFNFFNKTYWVGCCVSTYLFMDLCFWRFLLSDLAINSYQEKNLCLSNFRNIHKIWKVIFSFLCLLFVLLVSFSQSASHVIPNIDKYKYERNYEWCLGVCQPAIHLQPCLL